MSRRTTTAVLTFACALVGVLAAKPATAQVTVADYKFPPEVNIRVSQSGNIEVWARVYRPAFVGTQKYPLIVMLHGAHGTCGRNTGTPRIDDDEPQSSQYALQGTCPPNYSVVKSHEGYAYLANDLAARGYIVVSINANRGFNHVYAQSGDSGQLRTRGRLVLWHLKQLSNWNDGSTTTPASLGVTFKNRIDFSQVGLMGHSRGALAMRSVIADYRDSSTDWSSLVPNMTVRGLMEIAPPLEESTEAPIIRAYEVNFVHLVGLCDGENPSYVGDPVSSKVYDQFMRSGAETGSYFKAQYAIEGANHRYFNTQWQQNDTPKGCVNQTALFTGAATEAGSQSQQNAALVAVRNFFQGTVGVAKDPSLTRIFNPTYPAPSGPKIQRAFNASPTYQNSQRLEDFENPTGINSNWVANDSANLISYFHTTNANQHDEIYPMSYLQWGAASTNTYLQTNWKAINTGQDFRGYQYLEFRVGGGGSPATEFSIQLVNSNNTRSSSVSSASYVTLSPPPGSKKDSGGDGVLTFFHDIMKTVRIPLSAFGNATLSSIRGARFVFDRTSNTSIYLGSVFATTDSSLTRGRPVVVSTVESNNATLGGGMAVDGNGSTRWSSAFFDPQSIYVDLGWSKTFKTVVLRWEAAFAKSFKIQTSTDAANWTDVYSTTTGAGGTQIIPLATQATARYVRVLGQTRATQYGYSLYELEVYPN